MGNFKDLLVWQKSVDFVTEIYVKTEIFPKNEIFGIVSQMRRASVSIPSNISEGHSRRSTPDFIQFLKIARGSCAEIETQLLISKNLNFLDDNSYEFLESQIIEISKMINSLITSLKTKL